MHKVHTHKEQNYSEDMPTVVELQTIYVAPISKIDTITRPFTMVVY